MNLKQQKNYETYFKKIETDLASLEKQNTEATEFIDKVSINNILLLEVASLLKESLKFQVFKPDPENPASVSSQEKKVTTAGIAEQLADVLIPFGHFVTIKAKVTNTDTVRIGKSKLDVEDDTKAFPLEAGEAIEYKVRNLSIFWVDADVSGEGIDWTVEEEIKET